MTDLLVPVSTKATQSKNEHDYQHHSTIASPEVFIAHARDIQSIEQALDILKSHPNPDVLFKTLQWISGDSLDKPGVEINTQTAQASRLCHVLVNEIVPDYWSQLCNNKSKTSRSTMEMMILILSSVSGLSAIALRMRLLIKPDAVPEENSQIRYSGRLRFLGDLLSFLETMLDRDNFLSSVWLRLNASLPSSPRRHLLWKELVTLFGNGRVLSISAEAEDVVSKGSPDIRERSWLAEGSRYSSWLGRNLCDFLSQHDAESNDVKQPWAQMLERAATLGHIAKTHLSPAEVGCSHEKITERIGCVAALLHRLVRGQKDLTEILHRWLTGEGVMQDLRIRRVVIATLADEIGTTENLLLLAGYTHRKEPEYVARLAQSSLYLNAISNRLAASSPRATVLGMYVGTAVSELVDAPDKRMNFSSEELASAQGRQYLSLSKVEDPFRSIGGLKRGKAKDKQVVNRRGKAPAVQHAKPSSSNSHLKASRVISIEEVESASDSEEEDDLPVYAKPDSDASDSDEDPTVINREKPTAPVYIDDLISGLRDTENYDRHNLALTHASTLIRRKASFGTEVTDSAQDLASIFTGLQDKWNIPKFEELRLQAMIAVLVAQPLEMGQWFSAAYFNGDYSISQRAAILTTLGLGARELAGYGKDDAALTKSSTTTQQEENPPLFPSKRLPPKLHALYASPETAAITAASQRHEQSILRPMALSAADALSGPNALKTRTFSSRLEVERKRTKPIPNALAKIVADGFFLPLTGRWSMHVQG
ncbi:MAG: hypothetical protein LQ348_005612, partial [Seirophora lacunosa]